MQGLISGLSQPSKPEILQLRLLTPESAGPLVAAVGKCGGGVLVGGSASLPIARVKMGQGHNYSERLGFFKSSHFIPFHKSLLRAWYMMGTVLGLGHQGK